MAAADYRLMTEATGQRIAAALEALSGFGAYLTTADVVNNLINPSTSTIPSTMALAFNSANVSSSLQSISFLQQNSGYISNGIKVLEIQFRVLENIAARTDILNLPQNLSPLGFACGMCLDTNASGVEAVYPLYINYAGVIKILKAMPAGYYALTATYR